MIQVKNLKIHFLKKKLGAKKQGDTSLVPTSVAQGRQQATQSNVQVIFFYL